MRSDPTISATVWLPSTIFAMRSQVVNGNARSAGAGTSARSNATMPKLPACSTRVVAFSARAASPVSRIQRTRERSSPAAPADTGSNRSVVSTSATSSPRAAAAASAWHSTAVRPDDRGPTISESCPRANPPPSAASTTGRPVEARSSGDRGIDVSVSVTSSFRARSSDSR